MKQIIDGKTYNTETATEIGPLGSDGNTSSSDFQFWTAALYRTKNGRYFMAGRGGARSPFSQPYGQNGSQGSEGIVALSAAEALAYAEAQLPVEIVEEFFGDQIEEA